MVSSIHASIGFLLSALILPATPLPQTSGVPSENTTSIATPNVNSQKFDLFKPFFNGCPGCEVLHTHLSFTCQETPANATECVCERGSQGIMNACIQCIVDQGGSDTFNVPEADFSAWMKTYSDECTATGAAVNVTTAPPPTPGSPATQNGATKATGGLVFTPGVIASLLALLVVTM